MRGIKTICKELIQELLAGALLDKARVKDCIRQKAAMDEAYGNRIFEVGVSAVWKRCERMIQKAAQRSKFGISRMPGDKAGGASFMAIIERFGGSSA